MGRKAKHQIFIEKSKKAANAAIGQYNHPNNTYREEAFAILMVNAWELLLKAKVLKRCQEDMHSIYIEDKKAKRKDGKPFAKPKYKLHEASGYYATKGFRTLIEDNENVESSLKKQLEVLMEIRNNAVHFILKSDPPKKKFLSVFVATLKSYILFLQEEFKENVSTNFHLIPIAFNIPESFQGEIKNSEARQLIKYIEKTHQSIKPNSKHQVCVDIDIKFKRSQVEGIPVTLSKEGVPITQDSEERFRNKYPWNYTKGLIPALKKFKNFKQDKNFHTVKKELEKNAYLSAVRYLDWKNKSGVTKRFYSPDIIAHFAKVLRLKK